MTPSRSPPSGPPWSDPNALLGDCYLGPILPSTPPARLVLSTYGRMERRRGIRKFRKTLGLQTPSRPPRTSPSPASLGIQRAVTTPGGQGILASAGGPCQQPRSDPAPPPGSLPMATPLPTRAGPAGRARAAEAWGALSLGRAKHVT